MATEPIVRVVDDDLSFLNAMERTLRGLGWLVASFPSAHAFLASFEPERAGCLITDLRMPGMDGLELQRTVTSGRGRGIPIVFITGHGDASTATSAMKAGAVDFLEKPFGERRLLASVQQALERDACERRLAREKDLVHRRHARLSPREREVFRLVVSDLSNKEVARRLRISPRTVEHHREHVMLKMGARSLTELITMAVICGIHELHLRL